MPYNSHPQFSIPYETAGRNRKRNFIRIRAIRWLLFLPDSFIGPSTTYAFSFGPASGSLQESHYCRGHVLLVHRVLAQDEAADAEVHTPTLRLLGRLTAGTHFRRQDKQNVHKKKYY